MPERYVFSDTLRYHETMLKRLLLENFMAHGRTELEFGPGVTVLMGANNTGKSAVVEALRCLATNPIPRYYIRHGAAQARVELEFDTGHRVAWIRKERYALYEIHSPGQNEPTTYAKFGRNTPEDVLALLRLGNVFIDDADSKGIDVHLGNQREPVFLLNRSGTVMADFFAASSESAYLLSMQQALKVKISAQKKEFAAQDARLEAVRRRLDRLAPLPSLALGMERAAVLLDAVAALERSQPRLEQTSARLRGLLLRQSQLARALESLEPLAQPPDLHPVDRLGRWLDEHRSRSAAAALAARRLDLLARILPAPALAESGRLATTTARLAELRQEHQRLAKRSQTLAALTSAPALFPASGLATLRARRTALALARDTGRQANEILTRLLPPPALFPAATLRQRVAGLLECSQTLDALRHRLAALQALREPAPLRAASPLEHCLTTLRSLRAQRDELQRRSAILDGLTAAPPLSVPVGLESALTGIKRLLAARNTAQEAARQAEQALAAMASTVAERLTRAGVCPLCGAALTVESFLGRKHEHD